ncbi:MAG: type III-B CRISPR module-associated protein Cmr3 [Nitrospirae bacterium]|nr:type III-B CRISPR module-associated protein Cmr3 [Nitrospirota bacterium]
MHTHLLMPLAPLVLRTGKPFGETGGDDTFLFPLPSTVAGSLRAAHADSTLQDFRENRGQILSWASHGALPAEIVGDSIHPLFPRPADAVYLSSDGETFLKRLSPADHGGNEGCDLDGLTPVFLDKDAPSKPKDGPAWWTEDAMERWLSGETPDLAALGPMAPPIDLRSHVALEPSTLSASTGKLFQSAGPDFESRRNKPVSDLTQRGWTKGRYGLLARFANPVEPTLLRLGGEGRLAHVSQRDAWPQLPDSLRDALNTATHIRMLMATPALFTKGWRPGWLGDDLTGTVPGTSGLVLRLKAAAVDRWRAISGWDMVARKPKAVRRMVPAGAVYWFEVVKPAANWADDLWLAPISDAEHDRKDGFGLVLPGIWNRTPA